MQEEEQMLLSINITSIKGWRKRRRRKKRRDGSLSILGKFNNLLNIFSRRKKTRMMIPISKTECLFESKKEMTPRS